MRRPGISESSARLRRLRGVLGPALCVALLWSGELNAVGFTEFVDPNPSPGNQFGQTVVALSTGNVVITSPFDDFGGTNAGAVYLFNGATGALISTLRGSFSSDNIGSGGVTALTNGNYVVVSPGWNNGVAALNAGAVTWGSGTTGVSGMVSAANSLVGSTDNDVVGMLVTVLSNGNYVVATRAWDNVGAPNAGAATWGSGTTGVSGTISAANSLVGTTESDRVGDVVTALSNGNYVVGSPGWNGGIGNANRGAATWGNGTTGVTGTISAANSLIGSTGGDQVGGVVTALSNGNYVVQSETWNNGAIVDAGAATWGSGTSGVSGPVTVANSLVGSATSDFAGSSVTALTNGNYVVANPSWNNGAILDAGAATWGNGATGVIGMVSAANSLVGSATDDRVGVGGVVALTNGNYVVVSRDCNLVASGAGAVTWGNGTTGVSGPVSAVNSLVGSSSTDQVGNLGVVALSNGNYVVMSTTWDNGVIPDAGAATWGSGTAGVSGPVSAVNSLVGSTSSDQVGNPGVVALSNGNYVVMSTSWDNPGIANAGAATWGSGTAGVSGPVSAANSLVGATLNDGVGQVVALANGNYVARSPLWNKGAIADAGAATWGSGATGVSGEVTAGNSLVGSTANDRVGFGVEALPNGNYVVLTPTWSNGAVANVGAVTWGSGATGAFGTVSAANSLVGSTAIDNVGNTLTALSTGDYVVATPNWDNGAVINACAATWRSGGAAVSGVVSVFNSLVGTAPSSGLEGAVVEDTVNGTFLARFLTEGGGRVRVGAGDPSPVVVSATDVPSDQGGRLRLTFLRSFLDDAAGSPPVAAYGVWRRVPGTLAGGTGNPRAGGALDPVPGARATEQLRALLPAGLEARESEGRLYVTGADSPSMEVAAVFPPGTWALVMSFPAAQQAQYVVELSTPSNTPGDYVVTAHTTVPSSWYISNVVSGQSADNLAPAQPAGFTAAFVGLQTNLQWAPNIEPDLASYHLHRGTSADFIPSAGNRIAAQTSTSHADVGPMGGYYKLSAVDVSGNESGFALVTPQQTTDVGDGAPVAFALEGARPNPTRGKGLHVAFALPSAAPARLELHDVSGRCVLMREVGSLGAGRHTVNLGEGRRVAAGVYWVSLTQGDQQQRTRVAVIQ